MLLCPRFSSHIESHGIFKEGNFSHDMYSSALLVLMCNFATEEAERMTLKKHETISSGRVS
jgi:hypothetical protein